MADRVREYLGVTLAMQYEWPDDDSALKAWRKALQDVGIFVFKDAFRTSEYFGFSLYDETFPIIYVNNISTKTRQIFTLFHEMAHILFHTSGIDTHHDAYIPNLAQHQQRIEVLCNRFAAAFLVPEAAFAAAMQGRERKRETAEDIAKRFHVSREVIYRKFLDRQWITRDEYLHAVEEWEGQRQRTGAGGDFYRTKISYLGREYITLAFSQYYQKRIGHDQLAEYLETKPRNISKLENYLMDAGA
jgi:Zn-dependent peptidase ImmA (M78 family)